MRHLIMTHGGLARDRRLWIDEFLVERPEWSVYLGAFRGNGLWGWTFAKVTHWYTHLQEAHGKFTKEIIRGCVRIWVYLSFQPNNIRGGNTRPSVGTSVRPSVRPYVRPQKVCPISMKFGMYIEVDEWCMMPYDPIQGQGQGHGASEALILHFSKSISSATYRGSWQMAINS